MSGGQFELAGEVVPRWFTARHAASYYVQDEDFAFGTFGDFVVDILDAVDPVIDLGRFDNDGHGNRADYSSGMAPGLGRHYHRVKPRGMNFGAVILCQQITYGSDIQVRGNSTKGRR